MLQTVHQTIKLHKIQQDFRRSKAIYKAFTGGRGSGKSWVGAYDMLRRAKAGRTYLVASPTSSKMGDETFPTLKAIAEDLDIWDPRQVKLTPYPTARLTTGATIRFRSADKPDTLRGPNLSGAWLDEGSLMDEMVFPIVIGCLREGGEQGWLSATFTPKGTSHWTYERFATGQPDTELFHCHTKDNPFLPPQFAATLAKQYFGAWAQQELGGLFVSMEGAEWPAEFFDGILFDEWPADSDRYLRVMSLDPSKGKHDASGDFSAWIMLAVEQESMMLWVDADLDARRPVEPLKSAPGMRSIVTDGIELFKQFQPKGVLIETNGQQELVANALLRVSQELNVPMPLFKVDNTDPKAQRIRTIGPILGQHRLRIRNTPGGRLLLGQMRDFRGDQKPSAGIHDDGCFVVGTMIETSEGPRPIEAVKVGDMVLTRKGYSRVLVAGCTGEKPVVELLASNGGMLVGTENHPVFDGIAFTPMRLARTMYSCHENTKHQSPNSSFLTESTSGDTRPQNNGRIVPTSLRTQAIDGAESERTIRNFGSPFTDQFLKVTRFTTPTATRSTTISAILSASQRMSTTSGIRPQEALEQDRQKEGSNLHPSFPLLPNGIAPKRDWLGTQSTERRHGSGGPSTQQSAFCVERHSTRFSQCGQSFAPITAEAFSGPALPRNLNWLANIAGNYSKPSINAERSALRGAGSGLMRQMVGMRAVSVIARRKAGRARVYNLTVEGDEEYFANGFLVHNCDALAMAIDMANYFIGGADATATNVQIVTG